ncbi:MAG TPA: TIM barrel protein [Bryobacteraceae bacterium]|nr:TIM barrel protein [Bryobacteraceae bacterium]
MPTRRQFLATTFAVPAAWTRTSVGRGRISAITDEIAKSPQEAIAFARQYGLSHVELRSVPGGGGEYARLPEDRLREEARKLSENGLKVSFLNTGMLKFGMPGTEPVRRREESLEQRAKRIAAERKRFDEHISDLEKAIRAAQIFNVDKVRVFTFSRVADPGSLYPKIAMILDGMARIARKQGIHLLIENEGSCNVGTCSELARILELAPASNVGINWDPLNGVGLKEAPFPDGYALLPKQRIGNVQIKGRSILDGPQKLDWTAIFEALERDGYKGMFGLETHIFGPTLIESSHASIREILRIAGS